MEVILSAILGIMIGIIITRLKTSDEIANLKWERNDYRQRLIKEKLKTEQRDILIRDLIKEPVENRKISN
jgi:hypothetical protein